MEYVDFIEKFLSYVESYGPLFGIFLPMIEAFIPILPLAAFVIINVNVFGFLLGYLYSWVGACTGSYLLFLMIKKIGTNKFEKKIKNTKYEKIIIKIKEKNISLLFLLYCFPFTPSFILSITAALANINSKKFFLVLLPSKFIMMISFVYIGENIKSFFINPLKSIFFIGCIFIFNYIAKLLIQKYENTIE